MNFLSYLLLSALTKRAAEPAERERRLFHCLYSSRILTCAVSNIRLVCLNLANVCIPFSGLTSAMKYGITVNELQAETIKEAS